MDGLFLPAGPLGDPLTDPYGVQPPRFATCCWPFAGSSAATPVPRMGHAVSAYEDPLQVTSVYSDDSTEAMEVAPPHLPLFQPPQAYHHRSGGVSCAKKYARKKPMTQVELDRKRVMANRQERRRMHRLNSALERLRQAIPVHFQQQPPRRLSKIKTLRMAINYISALDTALKESELCWTTTSKSY